MNNGNQGFLVRVSCMTYNHSAFIADALNGFAMQQTSFPFVCTIIDDASTDGEQEVVKAYVDEHFDMNDSSVFYEKEEEYGRVTFARHKTNANCYFAVIYLKENHYSQRKSKNPYIEKWAYTKYVALCEGDDYWTDPLKLQKQVDFMEGHPDFSMCFHSAKVLNETDSQVYIHCDEVKDMEYFSNDIYPNWVVPTASVIIKSEVLNRPIRHREKLLYGDIAVFLSASHSGRLWGMSEPMSVYRINYGGVTQKQEVDYRMRLEHEKCLRMNFPLINRRVISDHISKCYYSLSKKEKITGKLVYLLASFVNSPSFLSKKIGGFIIGNLFHKKI